jgi:hypothetical protein
MDDEILQIRTTNTIAITAGLLILEQSPILVLNIQHFLTLTTSFINVILLVGIAAIFEYKVLHPQLTENKY